MPRTCAAKTAPKEKGKAAPKKAVDKPDPRDPQGIFAAEFDRLDRNGDGSIDWKEFYHGLVSAGWDSNELSTLFETIDVSKDAKISREEYLNYHAGTDSKPMSLDPKAVFGEYDADKDEHLNLRELAKLIRKVENDEGFLGDTDFSSYVKEQLAAGDKDEDGKLNLAEFLKWYQGFVHHVEDIRERFEEEQRQRKAAREKANAPPPPPDASQFSGSGVWEVHMKGLMSALEAAWDKKRTPLLIDDTADNRDSLDPTPLELFLQYSNATLLEMKKMVVEVNMQKVKKLEDAMEEARKKLISALKHGNTFCLLLANSVPPIKSKFSSDHTLPLALFDGHMVDAVAGSAKLESTWVEQVMRKEDDLQMVRDKFRVLVVTKFKQEDYQGFLKDDVPVDLLQHIYVHNKKSI